MKAEDGRLVSIYTKVTYNNYSSSVVHHTVSRGLYRLFLYFSC